MANPPLSDELAREALTVYKRTGTKDGAARELGLHPATLRNRLKVAFDRGLEPAEQDDPRWSKLDPKIADHLKAKGYQNLNALHSGWIIDKNEHGAGDSLYFFLGRDEKSGDFLGHIRDVIRECTEGLTLKLPPRFDAGKGHLLVLDPADVHIGKLSVASETGYTYDAAVAEHRLVEGSRALMETAQRNGATHVLFVLGNDISHIDSPRRLTTSGTPQDTDGSIFTIYRVAKRAYIRVIEMGLEMGLDMQLVFNPSNHDWVLGYSIAETVAAWFRNHPNVTASPYAISERHRKYVRFGLNIIGLSHGDGAKEKDLGHIMLQEARPHMAECLYRYWYLHHYHHKMSKSLGIRPIEREKDHVGMSVMRLGTGAMLGDNVQVEHIRSPSAPDGWHDRNGYLNRQAVEAHVHDANEGQVMRFTKWF